MVASDSLAEFLREQLAPVGRVTMRRKFGKTGVFCEGLMLGMVTENTLYFRVDDHNRATFEEAESLPPLNYKKQGNTIDLSFWRAPERLFDEPDELVTWARAALASGRGEADSPKAKIKASTHEPKVMTPTAWMARAVQPHLERAADHIGAPPRNPVMQATTTAKTPRRRSHQAWRPASLPSVTPRDRRRLRTDADHTALRRPQG